MTKTMKSLVGIFAAGFVATSAFAQDFGPEPVDYSFAAEDYVESRLETRRGARISVESDPYQVVADFGRKYGEINAWAVDISVRSRIGSKSNDGVAGFTVIFVNGEPVAFKQDIRSIRVVRKPKVASST